MSGHCIGIRLFAWRRLAAVRVPKPERFVVPTCNDIPEKTVDQPLEFRVLVWRTSHDEGSKKFESNRTFRRRSSGLG